MTALVATVGVFVLVAIVVLAVSADAREALRSARQDWRMVHVPDRCHPHPDCTCPCGFCRHDRSHL